MHLFSPPSCFSLGASRGSPPGLSLEHGFLPEPWAEISAGAGAAPPPGPWRGLRGGGARVPGSGRGGVSGRDCAGLAVIYGSAENGRFSSSLAPLLPAAAAAAAARPATSQVRRRALRYSQDRGSGAVGGRQAGGRGGRGCRLGPKRKASRQQQQQRLGRSPARSPGIKPQPPPPHLGRTGARSEPGALWPGSSRAPHR